MSLLLVTCSRKCDLRVADAFATAPNIPVPVIAVQRTGPMVRAAARFDIDTTLISIELPHLHHDTPLFVPGAAL